MKYFHVKDSDLGAIQQSQYDLALFGCGYEKRCTHAPRLVERSNIGDFLVLSFEGVKDNEQRRLNDEYFDTEWTHDRLSMRADDEEPLFVALNKVCAGRSTLKLIVDYSSMSRLWYAGLLNWLRFNDHIVECEIDFIYSIGVYGRDLQPIVIDEILAIPGLEGGALRKGMCVAVFGLGFYGLMTQCVMEVLEPDVVYAFIAVPAADDSYALRVRKNNNTVILSAKHVLELPLRSVETASRYLKDLVVPYIDGGDVVLIPMGPKPHVLAALIVSLEFSDVACLRVGAKREHTENISAHGDVIVTRVQMVSFDSKSSGLNVVR